MNSKILLSKSVEIAIKKNQPIVALESTIISHGMPYPQNLQTALEIEQVVRENGAIPATIAVIEGELKVGLSEDEIKHIAQSTGVIKVSRRDLPHAISQKMTGATTVASTMILAEMAGIKIFATGGIGGVHRGSDETMDISADLIELSKTNVAVICAGVKSILDIPKTLEFLETFGVPVITVGSDEFPAFYTQKSGIQTPQRLNIPEDIARLLHAKWDYGLQGGVLITNPIEEKFSMDKKLIDKAINEALLQAKTEGTKGKNITPFLLKKITEITGGDSLVSNIALVKNNARLASKIAIELAKN